MCDIVKGNFVFVTTRGDFAAMGDLLGGELARGRDNQPLSFVLFFGKCQVVFVSASVTSL